MPKQSEALAEILRIARDHKGCPPEDDFAAWILWYEAKLVAIVAVAEQLSQ